MKRHLMRATAALVAFTFVHPLWAAPGDITQVPAPMLGADPPKARDISDGDASVATQTGALNYAYPIAVPPGRRGMQPALALSYSSQAPLYGGVAANWSLQIPEIRLDTSESVLQQKYFANLASDPWARQRFVSTLSGSRPLVEVTEDHESTVYKTFRAQNDASWIRYERMKEGQLYRWRARTPEGLTHYFGDVSLVGTPSSNVVPLTRTVDAFGNTVEYDWDGGQIEEIRYTSNPGAQLPAFARVEFEYADESCGRIPVGAAEDARLGWIDGARRLTKIRAVAFEPGSGAAQHTREYTLDYDEAALSCTAKHAPIRLLESIQESAWIAGQAPVDLPPVTFTYNRLAREFDLASTEVLNNLWMPDPATDVASLSVGKRPLVGWPAVDAMMLDFDGDGLVDRISHVPDANECVFQWERNEGRNASGHIDFAAPIQQVMPRLPWEGAQRSASEGCSLNYQFTRRGNIPDPAGPCNDNLGSYLAYRWLDINSDGRVDLVAAVHSDFHYDPNLETSPGFFSGLRIGGSWPSCTPDDGACPALSAECMQGALECEPEQPCRLHEPAVSSCLASSERVTCDRLMRGMDQYGADDPDQNPMGPDWPTGTPPGSNCGLKREHERCDRFPWMIYENVGGAFEAVGEVKYQPVPLESDGGDSAMAGGSGYLSTSHAIQDMDGDGFVDLAVRGRFSEFGITTNPLSVIWWFVFRGDGTGSFLFADDGYPYVWYVPENAQILGTCPSDLSVLCHPSVPGGDDGVINGYSSLLDLNGDGAADYVWSLSNGSQLEAHAFWGTGLQFKNYGPGQPSGYPVGQSLGLLSRAFVHADQRITQGAYYGFIERGWRHGHNQAVDVDDDGRPDLVTSALDQYTLAPQPGNLYFNAGGTFLAPHNLNQDVALQQALVQRMEVDDASGAYTWATKRDLIDMDGDGLPEHWYFPPAGDVVVTRDVDDQPLRLLKSIDNGRGGTVEIEYAATTDEAVVTQNASSGKALPRTQWVVESMTVRDLWSPGDAATTSYEYKHPVWNQDERDRWGFRGFEEVTTTAPSGARTIDTYAFNVDWSGRQTASRTYSTEDTAGPRTISETTWEPRTLFGGALTTYHTTHTRDWTCSNGQTEAQCKAANAGFHHKIWIYQTLPSSGTAQLYVPNQIYDLDIEWYGYGGRRTLLTHALLSDATRYRLQQTFSGILRHSNPLTFGEEWATYTIHGYDAENRYRKETATYFDPSDWSKRGVTTWAVDAATGVLLSEQQPRNYPSGPVTSYVYDPTKRFAITTTNELSQAVVREYEPGTGALLSERGPSSSSCGAGCTNWQQTWTDVDGLGRPIATHTNVPIGTNPVWQKTKDSRTAYTDAVIGGARTKVVVENLIEWGADRWTREETRLDGRGRPEQIIVETGGTGPDAVTTYDYDARGNLAKVYLPDPSQNSTGTVMYTYGYDSLGRPTSMRRPAVGAGAASGIDLRYNGVVREREEVAGGEGGPAALTKLVHDNFGRLIQVHEHTGQDWAITQYEYDARDAITRIQNPDGVVTQLFHDMGGRRTRIVRAGKTWTYGYNNSGDMTSEAVPPPTPAEAAAYTTTYAYDFLGRLLSRNVGIRTMTDLAERQLFGIGTIEFDHDTCANGTGRLCAVDFPHGVLSTTFTYDADGNQASETRAFNFAGVTGTRTTSAAFGPGGRIVDQTYADNASGASNASRAHFVYDDRGLPQTVQWLRSGLPAVTVADQHRNVAGLVTERETALATSGWLEYASTWSYDKLTRVESQTITDSLSSQLARQQLEYFGQDDPSRLEHWMGSSYYDLGFTYDARHQLINVHEAGDRFDADYGFTAAGKLSNVSVNVRGEPSPGSDVIPREVTYAYASPSDPEAVSALIPNGGGDPFRSYTYDTVGNMVTRAGGPTSDEFLYDGEDQLRRAVITDAATSDTTTEEYFYDHTGNRTAVVTRDSANIVTSARVFLGDTEILLTPGAATKTYAHLSLGTPVARITDRTTLELQYHGLANNTLLSIKPDGATSSGFVYAPYGELLETIGTAVAEQHRRFNDKFRDDATSLSYYGYRYYDGVLLGWTQADPLFRFSPDAAWTKPRLANLYSFNLGNPVRYLDPDGRTPALLQV